MAITYDQSTRTFYLDGKGITYAFFINAEDYAEHLYYGKAIGHDDLSYIRRAGTTGCASTIPGRMDLPWDESSYNNFPSEISFHGTSDYREPTVHLQNALGDRLTELLYDSHEILPEKPKMKGMPSMKGGETLLLHLKDRVTGFAADLYYTVYDDCSVIARRIVYKNGAATPVTLRRAYSFSLALPVAEYDVITLYGGWAAERRIDRVPLHHGVASVDSKRTTSSSIFNPFMALPQKNATELSGNVYGVGLVYSSSYVLKAERSVHDRVQLCGGIQDFDFSWILEAGESFETPEVVLAYSDEGISGMSRALHDAFRNHLINPRFAKAARPIVINNWEGTYFNFNLEKLKAIADGVRGTGIDTFVLDDGWFGKRENDKSGLGDWVVNTNKLEGGLTALSDYLHSVGLKFGLWFEPEMISEDSDLFRAHPDYAIGVPNRPRCYGRNQYMLDLTRAEVRDYIVESVNSILHNHRIEYVKWDYNRNVTESYSFGRAPERQAEFAHRYALGLYELCERIVEANPDVFFEGCSAGGARFDPAMLHYFPQIWTSDDSDAEERTKIQYGTSMAYPLSAMSCHVSAVPNHQTGRITPNTTRVHIAHLGATGYELDAANFTDEDRARVKEEVDAYKASADLILYGDLYRINDPTHSNFFGFCVVSKDKSRAEITAYRRMGGIGNPLSRFTAVGLDENKRYYVKELGRTLSGSTLMNVGFIPQYPRGDFGSIKYHITEE